MYMIDVVLKHDSSLMLYWPFGLVSDVITIDQGDLVYITYIIKYSQAVRVRCWSVWHRRRRI